MNQLNVAWFGWLAAGSNPSAWALALAKWLAHSGSIGLVLVLLALWWRSPKERLYLAGVVLVCCLANVLAHMLAAQLAFPRPFVLGLSPVYVAHAARGALPSAHGSVLWAAAFCLLMQASLRRSPVNRALLALFVLGAIWVCWARIYLGLHFPLDMVAGMALGLLLAVAYRTVWAGLRRLVLRNLVQMWLLLRSARRSAVVR